MGVLEAFDWFIGSLANATSPGELAQVLTEMTERLGYDYFALTHHVDWGRRPPHAFRLHNYPAAWVDYFDAHNLGGADPVQRASERTQAAFHWARVPKIIAMTRQDHAIRDLAAAHGMGDGFTVPANVPGEIHGSCSFAVARGRALPRRGLLLAQLAGGFAFDGARRVFGTRDMRTRGLPALTDRQRECLVWAALGKSDWEISRILGISEETVSQHIRQACERYDVQKRTSLLFHALLDGAVSFAQVARHAYPAFPG